VSPAMARCKHCSRLLGTNGRRGLCRGCYKDPATRAIYPAWPTGVGGGAAPPGWLPWTDEELELLRDLTMAGWTAAEIAARLGRAVRAVYARRIRQGIPGRAAGKRFRPGMVRLRRPLQQAGAKGGLYAAG
jgi:hypothetical protein